ncbi:hypothetical protein PRIPAC_76017 [Pristionchus pacificus]|uniref:Uncharacterized protein n=1 Tax=Pristionchus pacificus TaxID=54126 RepID=A0A2A6CS82_PRIPA|nr:hypothetical protein PRIPAC_76017 [Pristionchus pacificus]|eukprot:PDM81055.1 hypothetical protein PRIPAC_36058 [Pristionchus pacificus]
MDRDWMYHCVLTELRIGYGFFFDYHKVVDLSLCIAILIFIFKCPQLRLTYSRNFAIMVALKAVILLGHVVVKMTAPYCLNRPLLVKALINLSFLAHSISPSFILSILLGMIIVDVSLRGKIIVYYIIPSLLTLYPIFGQLFSSEITHVIYSDRILVALAFANCVQALFVIYKGQYTSFLPILITIWEAAPLFLAAIKMTHFIHRDNLIFIDAEILDDFVILLDPTDAGTTRFPKVPRVPSPPAKRDGTRRFGKVTVAVCIVLAVENGFIPVKRGDDDRVEMVQVSEAVQV